MPCAVNAFILAGLGWAIDSIFKPRLSVPVPPRAPATGTWRQMEPLFLLLALLLAGVGLVEETTDLSAVAAVMTVVPVLSIGWLAIQERDGRPGTARRVGARMAGYVVRDLPGYRSELVLLTMAGFIGTLGSRLVAPLVAHWGIDLAAVPAPAILVALVWLIPLAGQLGMNPILFVSLAAPLLPDPEIMGVAPSAVIAAMTAGWALSGASSPYTATTMLVGSLGGVSASHVGTRWNGAFVLIGGLLLSAWVVAVSRF